MQLNTRSRKAAFDVFAPLKSRTDKPLQAFSAGRAFSLLGFDRTMLRYAFIGASAALLDFLIFVFLYEVVGIGSIFATVCSIAISTVYGFFMNARLNFKVSDRMPRRFLSYASVSVFALVASALSLFIFAELLGANGILVKALSLPPIVLIQYLLNRRFSFSPFRAVNNLKQI